jgi:hypothetical protein
MTDNPDNPDNPDDGADVADVAEAPRSLLEVSRPLTSGTAGLTIPARTPRRRCELR